jgi:hypothetical protein
VLWIDGHSGVACIRPVSAESDRPWPTSAPGQAGSLWWLTGGSRPPRPTTAAAATAPTSDQVSESGYAPACGQLVDRNANAARNLRDWIGPVNDRDVQRGGVAAPVPFVGDHGGQAHVPGGACEASEDHPRVAGATDTRTNPGSWSRRRNPQQGTSQRALTNAQRTGNAVSVASMCVCVAWCPGRCHPRRAPGRRRAAADHGLWAGRPRDRSSARDPVPAADAARRRADPADRLSGGGRDWRYRTT